MTQLQGISQNFSKTLNVCNVICTILVVAIHFNTKQHISFSEGLGLNFYIQEFITNGIARVAVPFFALVSGLFFFKQYTLSLSAYQTSLEKRLLSLGIPYVLGASIILIAELLYGRMVTMNDVDLRFIVQSVIIKPLSVQFWFIRDLLFLAIVSPLIYFLIREFKGLLALVLMVCWLFDIELTPTLGGRSIITIEVGAFFVLGAFIYTKSQLLDTIFENRSIHWLLIISLLLLLTRISIDPFMANWYTNNYTLLSLVLQNMFIMTFLIWLIFASNKLKDVEAFQYFAKFTFFVYLYHLLPLSRVYVKISDYFIPDAYKFYFTFPAGVIVTFCVAIVLRKYTKPLYQILTGGRV